MFRFPDAKRVKRTELHGSPSPDTTSPSPAPRPSFEYDLIDATSQSRNAEAKHDAEEGVSFRLFSSSAPTHRVTIRSPTPVSKGDGAFVVRQRSRGYYFADPAQRRHEFAQVAIAGQDVMAQARSTRWPGAEMSWRVIHVKDARLVQMGILHAVRDDHEGIRARARKGKKARIQIRKMHAAEVLKAETEKEKRTRRNREKKVKKKAREKVEKLERKGQV